MSHHKGAPRSVGQPLFGRGKTALARGLALFLGGFGLLNVTGNIWRPGFDANIWWLDARLFGPFFASFLIALASVGLVIFGVRPPRSIAGRWLISIAAGTLFAVAAANSLNFYLLLMRGQIRSRIPIPLSFFIAAALLLIIGSVWNMGVSKGVRLVLGQLPEAERANSPARAMQGLLSSLAVCVGCAIMFPLGQMVFFGKTDYRRQATVTVVFGARVYADGRPSDALGDRVRTACKLYRSGLTQKLLFSGGPGDGLVDEPEAMKRMAIQLGVKTEDILLDKKGLNTESTVSNTKRIFATLQPSRILVVSHFYHLPRIKLAYQREGLEVYTVPAKETYLLRQIPYNMAREVAALWVYYLRPLEG